MILGKCTATNFCSYKHIEFNFNDLGLTLIHGPTGSGKSNLCDLPCWVLYGVTSKDGNSDDIKNWCSDEITTATLDVKLPTGSITVHRTRGKPHQNDLYWQYDGTAEKHRGKSIVETQKLLEELLGVSKELFLLASYTHQFSKGEVFFVSKPSERRESMEMIVDQSFAIKLVDTIAFEKLILKDKITALFTTFTQNQGYVESLITQLATLNDSSINWENNRQSKLMEIKQKIHTFEMNQNASLQTSSILNIEIETIQAQLLSVRADIESFDNIHETHGNIKTHLYDRKSELRYLTQQHKILLELPDTCPTCLGMADNAFRVKKLEELTTQLNNFTSELQIANCNFDMISLKLKEYNDLCSSERTLEKDLNKLLLEMQKLEQMQNELNPHAEQSNQLTIAINPFTQPITKLNVDLDRANAVQIAHETQLAEYSKLMQDYDILHKLSFTFRGVILSRAVGELESRANGYLEKYFDSMFKVRFILENKDNLEVVIYNEGIECSFRQLSGGQRCLLKLAFGISLMKLSQNKTTSQIGLFMFDEVLNGLDGALKVKAFNMFQELSLTTPSILLIDHSETLKTLFTNSYNVRIDNGVSSIYVDT